MRLWHQDLLPYLPRQQLLGQHRECCALRGKGWGKKHSVVDYVFRHPYSLLFYYHTQVMREMMHRGYKVDSKWEQFNYHGKKLGFTSSEDAVNFFCEMSKNLRGHRMQRQPDFIWQSPIAYEEHDDKYLRECVDNLRLKDVKLVNGMSISEFDLMLAINGL